MTQSRFEIDFDAFRKQQLRRKPVNVVKEIISNFFDEDSATNSEIFIEGRQIEYHDNGRGFSNPEDVFRLYGQSIRAGDPTKRGRFNRGEKEFNAVCDPLIVETSGWRFYFKGDTRTQTKMGTMGVYMKGTLLYSDAQIDSLYGDLRKIIVPEGKKLQINETTLEFLEPVRSFDTVLPTWTEDGNPTSRSCIVSLYEPKSRPKLYELGIPVQSITGLWDVNVMQKIPLSPERDSVKETYLKQVYTTIVNNAHDLIPAEKIGSNFVKIGLNEDSTEEAVQAVHLKKFGNSKVALYSSNPQDNDNAIQQGYTIIPRGEYSPEIRKVLIDTGTVVRASDFAYSITDGVEEEPSDEQKTFAQDINKISNLTLGKSVTVRFFRANSVNTPVATYGNNTFTVYTRKFPQPYSVKNSKALAVVFHELGHDAGKLCGEMGAHEQSWGNEVARIAAEYANRSNSE